MEYSVENIFSDSSYFYVIVNNQESDRRIFLYDIQGNYIDEIYELKRKTVFFETMRKE